MTTTTENILALMLVLLVSPACVAGGSLAALDTGPLDGSSGGSGRQEVVRQGGHVGTVFDFRYARVVSALEMAQSDQKLVPESGGLVGSEESGEYTERKFLRLDVPLLSFWDADRGFGYPGTSVHRTSFDLWARGGYIRGDTSTGFAGGALTYYTFGGLAVSLTADYMAENTTFRMSNSTGGVSSFDGTHGGVAIGLEVTIAAGEYALDIFRRLGAIDDKVRNSFPSSR